MTSYIGPLAQLGERLPCTQEVVGAEPTRSTNGSPEEGYLNKERHVTSDSSDSV